MPRKDVRFNAKYIKTTADNRKDNKVQGEEIGNSTILAKHIADGAITADKFAPGAVSTAGIADGSITTNKIADGSVTNAKLANDSVTADKIATGAVGTTEISTSAEPTVSTIYSNNWFRSNGASGWYNQTYGGGIYMLDASWVRVYNNKGFYTGGEIQSAYRLVARTGDNRIEPGAWDKIILCANGVNTGGGYFYYNSNNSYGVISDRRIKTDIESIPTQDAIRFIKQLNPVTFGYKDNKDAGKVCGFIAQEVLAAAETEPFKNIVPNHEQYNESKQDCPYLGVSDHSITPSIIVAVQHLLTTVEKQQKTIDSLEARLNLLEDLLK